MKVLGLVSLGRPSGDPGTTEKWKSFLPIAEVLIVSLIGTSVLNILTLKDWNLKASRGQFKKTLTTLLKLTTPLKILQV